MQLLIRKIICVYIAWLLATQRISGFSRTSFSYVLPSFLWFHITNVKPINTTAAPPQLAAIIAVSFFLSSSSSILSSSLTSVLIKMIQKLQLKGSLIKDFDGQSGQIPEREPTATYFKCSFLSQTGLNCG